MPESLCCVLCLYDNNPAPANDAVTIINGNAVCYDHMNAAPHGDLSRAIVAVRRNPIERPAKEDTDAS